MVVASTNDPWVSHEVARGWAARWNSRFVSVGAQGHINGESGHGPWPQGWAVLDELLEAAPPLLAGHPQSTGCANETVFAA
jgi:predicted alpha/beta hydrolase family esterase